MAIRIDGDDIIFSSGRVRDFNGGIVGLSPSLSIHGGFDQDVHAEYHQSEGINEYQGLSADDIRELAELMIMRWQEAKEKADILSPSNVNVLK
jgi:hypothetical protein